MIPRLLLVSALVLASASGQTTAPAYPLPTPTQQKGIDTDTARHFGDAPADPGPLATDLSPALTPAAIDKATRKVADWELAVAQPNFDHNWTWACLLYTSDSTHVPDQPSRPHAAPTLRRARPATGVASRAGHRRRSPGIPRAA